MSKVICDVCGTAFADSADQCPICGTAKSEASRPAPGGDTAESGYAYVKGGRFSQANVRKYNSGKRELPRTEEEPKQTPPNDEKPPKDKPARKQDDREPEDEQPSNIGLIIVVVILLIAVLAVSAYIAKYIIDKYSDRNAQMNESSSTVDPTDDITEPQEILCQGISITGPVSYEFTSATDAAWISVVCDPADTTELLEWTYDEGVVSVSKNGDQWYISAVAPGETVITVRCGEFEDSITVLCSYSLEPEPTEPEETQPQFTLKLKRSSRTIYFYGRTYNLYDDSAEDAAPVSDITWTTSDASVATVENGVVTVWSDGKAVITASYGGQSVSCEISAKYTGQKYLFYSQYGIVEANDTTISVGTTLKLHLRDAKTGTKITEGLTFTGSDDSIITVDANGNVTALASGKATVYVEYEGVTYELTVRVTG